MRWAADEPPYHEIPWVAADVTISHPPGQARVETLQGFLLHQVGLSDELEDA